jgi:two-component system, OmpR family, sensor histidine kinase MtrB
VIDLQRAAEPGSTPRAGVAPRAVWHALIHRVTGLADAMRRSWRRSLQLRMVTTTLVASSVLVGMFGYLVVTLTTDSALERAVDDARRQVEVGAEAASEQLAIAVRPSDVRRDTLRSEVNRQSDGGRLAALVPPPNVTHVSPEATRQLPIVQVIPDELSAAVSQGQLARQIVTVTVDPDQGPVTYLIYGAPVTPGWGEGMPFELYHLIPLTAEQEAAADVRNTVLVTGAALILLLVVVTGLVTRLVVRPVRLASRAAQRLSAGLLDQRMTIRGEDDLALLGESFNQMAGNLQRQIVRLEEMSRQQRRFTSDVSHELRTPLTTVRMAADLLFNERGSYPPEVARSAELLQHELDRFENLLSELLEISRFDAGFATLDHEPADLGAIVRQAVERLGAMCERADTPVRVDLPDDVVIADVDPRRLERILRNLVGNAVEHGEGHPVVVTLASDANAAAITVRDYGVGLRPGEEEQVFSRFWRADPSRARQTGGTGLGLSISMEDAKLHSGWLQAWGVPGRGAQFRLTVPLRAGERLESSPLPLVPGDYRADDVPSAPSPVSPTSPGGGVGDVLTSPRAEA